MSGAAAPSLCLGVHRRRQSNYLRRTTRGGLVAAETPSPSLGQHRGGNIGSPDRVKRRDQLGGLIHEYHAAAA
jgi:hypothetical protein